MKNSFDDDDKHTISSKRPKKRLNSCSLNEAEKVYGEDTLTLLELLIDSLETLINKYKSNVDNINDKYSEEVK